MIVYSYFFDRGVRARLIQPIRNLNANGESFPKGNIGFARSSEALPEDKANHEQLGITVALYFIINLFSIPYNIARAINLRHKTITDGGLNS